MTDFSSVRALLFDVFGTCVDWRTSITDALAEAASDSLANESNTSSARSKAKEMTRSDWEAFAVEWRKTYMHFTRSMAKAENPTPKTVDQHHLESLYDLLSSRGLILAPTSSNPENTRQAGPGSLWNDEQIEKLSKSWHDLKPWKDTLAGIEEFNKHYVTATLTNANTELINNMVKNTGMAFQHIFDSELLGVYKTNPAAYLGGAKRLGLEPSQCALVAAHLGDLEAAHACGYKTIYVERLHEESGKPSENIDMIVRMDEDGFLTVADRLCRSRST